MIEEAHETTDDNDMPPEAIEAGITSEVWHNAQSDDENGFRTFDDSLRLKVPNAYNRYKELLAQRVEDPETPQSLVAEETEDTPEYKRELIQFMNDARDYPGGLEAFYRLPENHENAIRFGFLKEGVGSEDMAA